MTTLKQVREALDSTADSVGKNREGCFTARRGFFYRHGMTAEKFRAAVEARLAKLQGAEIIDCGEHYTAFSGGASLARSSHWWVTFHFPDEQFAVTEVDRKEYEDALREGWTLS